MYGCFVILYANGMQMYILATKFVLTHDTQSIYINLPGHQES